ncbi:MULTISPECIES: hypothetical protein [Pseudomonas]|uniref:Uncharacterized protein n=2 Tax=Pseudomonas TaxID=286 RepID=A0AAU7WQM8_9PSED
MPEFLKLNKYVIPITLLLAASTSAIADKANPIGDWWRVYSIGTGKNNIVFVADLTSMTPRSQAAGGLQSVDVNQVFADPSKPLADVYSVEVQCSKHRARFLKGTSIERTSYARRDLKVSNEWHTLDDKALLYTFAFVCNPQDRVFNGMLSLGKFDQMKMLGIITEVQAPPKSPMEELDEMLNNKNPEKSRQGKLHDISMD